MTIRRKRIRELTEQLLMQDGATRPVQVERIAKRVGLLIRKEPAASDLSGFLVRDAARGKPVIGVNSRQHKNRQRFTIAHELGHFLLHEGDVLHVDSDKSFRVNLRDELAGSGTDAAEKEANLFAAELLMPAVFLAEDVAKRGDFDALDEEALASWAADYAVSAQALGFRLAYLGYIRS